MRRVLPLFVLIFLGGHLGAQFPRFGDVPIEITADGEQKYEEGVASAQDNVVIQYGESTIYCDYAQYNNETREVLAIGRVRIYRGDYVFTGERAVYNLETKELRTADFRGDAYPFRFSSENFSSGGPNEFVGLGMTMTTSDSSKPDYRLRAGKVRIYPKDRVIFQNVTLFAGNTPVFWWPYLYQSLDKDSGFFFIPGYTNVWGASLLTRTAFPINDNVNGVFHLDLRSLRGVGGGLDLDFEYGKDDRSMGGFLSYLTYDKNPGLNKTAQFRAPIDPLRYRVSLDHRLYVTDDLYANIEVNKLSDPRLLEDFYPREFRVDPQPNTSLSITKWSENFTVTAIARPQINDFFGVTERLPELALDVKPVNIFGSSFFYDGSTTAGYLTQAYPDGSGIADYSAWRADTFHQIRYPKTYLGWLSVTPRLGFRGTWYSSTGQLAQEINEPSTALLTATASGLKPRPGVVQPLELGGSTFRPILNAGIEASFKVSKTWENAQSRKWGLDGLRHIIQPYTDLSYVENFGKPPDQILQFDRLIPSTKLPPITFPQFTSIDSIGSWNIWRFGVRNRLQTRRDDQTLSWFELDTFFDMYLEETALTPNTFSNINNTLRWNPLPWVQLRIDSQLPVFNSGFTEVNTSLSLMVNRNISLDIGNRYLNSNPFFQNSNLITLASYLRINDNWGFSFREEFEAQTGTLERQSYQIHRDLSSWTVSLGAVILDNSGVTEFGILLSFTLKDLPSITLPLSFNPETSTR